MTVLPVDTESGRRRGVRTGLRGFGQILITAGLVLMVFVAYELWWTGLTTQRDQEALRRTLEQQWSHTTSQLAKSHQHEVSAKIPALGSGFAILRIPRLGKNYRYVIVQGTSTADLIKGPGHYAGTALPGQVGNFAVAGHRTTYLHPFYNINELGVGDAINVETRTTWFTYRVENIPGTSAHYQEVVSPTDISVSFPVPDQPKFGATPTLAVLTLTSCNPRFSAVQRIVIHAVLVHEQPASEGLPPALRHHGSVGT
jgi:sortase A